MKVFSKEIWLLNMYNLKNLSARLIWLVIFVFGLKFRIPRMPLEAAILNKMRSNSSPRKRWVHQLAFYSSFGARQKNRTTVYANKFIGAFSDPGRGAENSYTIFWIRLWHLFQTSVWEETDKAFHVACSFSASFLCPAARDLCLM